MKSGSGCESGSCIRVYFLLADSNRIVHEARTDLFLKSVRVMRVCDDYRISFGPVEIVLPRAAGKQMVEDMLAMLDPEDQVEILRAAEENLRPQRA